ncbi:MAG: PASTA domain-containing protein [Spirochaetaceae bacterium]|jgi:beta-lactam-binding protein with PASTA domain|nr:PASTA domain-containing protein [Spirochaetaceae bacterium]
MNLLKGKRLNFGNGNDGQSRFFVILMIALIVFVGITAVAVFFISVQGAEEIMVPDVRGKDLTEALLELQVKELYPRLQLRYSQSANDKGQILEQDPAAGSIVKAGRRIRLVVSQGVVLNTLEDYLGRNAEEVRLELKTLFAASSQPLLTLKEPFLYEYSSEPPMTILQQKPLPGTAISGPTTLELVVSRGPEETLHMVPALAGLTMSEALDQIGRSGINFTFFLRPAEGEKPGTVISQEPAAQAVVTVDTLVSIGIVPPAPREGEVFGLFRYTLEENPYPLQVRLEARLPAGDTRTLLSVAYPGGELTVPYQLPVGSTLILFLLDREIYQEEVLRPPPDRLYPEQL